LLTTAVLALVEGLELPALPYAIACAFIANSASTLLPMSNPLNVLVLGSSHVHLAGYLAQMLPAGLAVTGLTIVLLWYRYRRCLAGHVDLARMPHPADGISHRTLFGLTMVLLAALVVGYLAAAAAGWPLSIPVLVAGPALLAVARYAGGSPLCAVVVAPWSILPFVAGLLVLVRGIEQSGVTADLGTRLLAWNRHGAAAGILGTTLVSASGSNVINNLPMGAVMASALRTGGGATHPALLFGTLMGADAGPNLTVLGSLSSMVWLLLVRRRGLAVSGRDYALVGLAVAPLLLLAGVSVLALTL
jgi:arsenical pump membrane protein